MKVLFDTDVLLDVALRRAPFFAASAEVVSWAERRAGQAAVAWHSLSNLAYLVRPDARDFIRDLFGFLEVPTVGTGAMNQALSFPMKDLEDAMQSAAALAFGAQVIVTRNSRHYLRSPVRALTPQAFLRTVGALSPEKP